MKYQTTLAKNPAGTYSFVGSVPASLFKSVEPTKSDIMAGRFYKDENGVTKSPRVMIFETLQEAKDYADSLNIDYVVCGEKD